MATKKPTKNKKKSPAKTFPGTEQGLRDALVFLMKEAAADPALKAKLTDGASVKRALKKLLPKTPKNWAKRSFALHTEGQGTTQHTVGIFAKPGNAPVVFDIPDCSNHPPKKKLKPKPQ